MPRAVLAAFEEFRREAVDLDQAQTQTARASRDYLVDQLSTLSRTGTELPALSGEFLFFGSFARRTKIRPLDDIDIMVIFQSDDLDAVPSTEPYTYVLRPRTSDARAVWRDYLSDGYFVNSTIVLNRFRDSLDHVANYRRAELHRTGEAVTLNLTSYPWTFDIVPACAVKNLWAREVLHFLIPNGRGGWKRTDPRVDELRLRALNRQHDGLALPVVRLIKYWNKINYQLPSYYIENLAIDTLDGGPHITSLPSALAYFLKFSPARLLGNFPDPKGLGPALDADVAADRKRLIEQALNRDAQHAENALMLRALMREEEAYTRWSTILGEEFPTYGD